MDEKKMYFFNNEKEKEEIITQYEENFVEKPEVWKEAKEQINKAIEEYNNVSKNNVELLSYDDLCKYFLSKLKKWLQENDELSLLNISQFLSDIVTERINEYKYQEENQ